MGFYIVFGTIGLLALVLGIIGGVDFGFFG